jgi:hypothetical protein
LLTNFAIAFLWFITFVILLVLFITFAIVGDEPKKEKGEVDQQDQ